MGAGKISKILQRLGGALLAPDGGDLTDGQLLEVFLGRRDGAAFEALLRRHGAMVLSVCRRILRNAHDAEDAFQATFVVLIRKAPEFADRASVANWLYGVAYHTALKARAAAAKRRAKESQVSAMTRPEARGPGSGPDIRPLIDQELYRLPARFREPVVLCDLEGKTRKEAAEKLGCPEGTVASRLARAHAILARRLARYGLALSTGSFAAVMTEEAASAGVPASLMKPTVQAALVLVAGEAVPAGLLSAPALGLAETVVRGMFLAKLRTAATATLAAAVVLGGLSLPVYHVLYGEAEGPSAPVRGKEAAEVVDRAVRASGGETALARLQKVAWRGTVRSSAQGSLTIGGTANGLDRWIAYGTVQVREPGDDAVLMTFKILALSDPSEAFVGFLKVGQPDPRAEPPFRAMKEEIRKAIHAPGLRQDLYAIRAAQVLLSLREAGVALSPAGDTLIDGRAATGVTVAGKGRPAWRLYFDQVTGLPVKCVIPVREDSEKPPVTHELFFGNFRAFAGVRTFGRVSCKRDGKEWFEIDLTQLTPQEALEDRLPPNMKDRYRD